MAICNQCKKEMGMVDTCDANKFKKFKDGTKYLSSNVFVFGIANNPSEKNINRRCVDCGIKYGGFHHAYCQYEQCPRCGGQLISCGCIPGYLSRD